MKKYALLFVIGSYLAAPSVEAAILAACDDSQPYTIDKKPICQAAPGFFAQYQQNRQQGIGNYLTEDFWLLAYSLTRQATLSELEQQRLMPALQTVIHKLAAALPKNDAIPTQASHDFLAVLQRLSSDTVVPLSARAQQELDLIIAAAGIAPSPLWQSPIDYSQFKPRGRYSHSEPEQRYFRLFRYASSVLFPLQASAAIGVNKDLADRLLLQAQQLTHALATIPESAELEAVLNWQMGAADDLTSADLNTACPQDKVPLLPNWRQCLLDYAKKAHKQPRIVAGLVDAAKLAAGQTAQDALTGWRLLPLRYSADSEAFQQLVYNSTGPYLGDCPNCATPSIGLGIINGQAVKVFPSSYEIADALGSSAAATWIKSHREDQFQGYDQAQHNAAQTLQQAQGLNGGQLQLMQHWLKGAPEDFAAQRLNSMLGFWTWQRYTNLLYAKQSYTLESKSLVLEKPRKTAWLAPATLLYRELLALTQEHAKQETNPLWTQLGGLLQHTVAISEKIDAKQPLTPQDIEFLNQADQTLKPLVGEDAPIITDVHSSPATGEVLQEALGYPNLVKHGQELGARWRHFEFRQALNQRMTDETWREQLAKKSLR